MKGDRGYIVKTFAFASFSIQSLDIAQSMRVADALGAHLIGRQTIEHECIVGVRAMRNGDFAHVRSRCAICVRRKLVRSGRADTHA